MARGKAHLTVTQLYFAIGIPSALFGLNFLGVRAAAFWQAKRFDDMKDLVRSEIGRVEGVLGAKVDALAVPRQAIEDEIHSPLVKQR